jgi:hypothetical protein
MRRFAVRAALVVFALRALLPSGYMPDVAALATAGHFEFVVCTAAQGDAPSAPQSPKPGHDECPFGMALAKTFVAPASPPVPAQFASIEVAAVPHHADGPPAVAQGPPFGQRGPPVLPA